MRAATILLCEPEGYTRVTNQLNNSIASTRTNMQYDETIFENLATITPNMFARYAATISVTANEAERWRLWAMAYIAMELEDQPCSKYTTDLIQARDTAHAIIDSNPKWVTTSVHPDSPGNYKPTNIQPQKDTAETGPLNTTQAENSSPDTENRMEADLTEQPFYDYEEDIEAMGPEIN